MHGNIHAACRSGVRLITSFHNNMKRLHCGRREHGAWSIEVGAIHRW